MIKLKFRNVNSSLKFIQPLAQERCWLAAPLYSVWFPAACQVVVGAVLIVGIHCCNNYKQHFTKVIFRTATVLLNVNTFFSAIVAILMWASSIPFFFFCRWYPQITYKRFPFSFPPQLFLVLSKFKNMLIHMKSTIFFFLNKVGLLCFVHCSSTVLCSWRTTSVYSFSKGGNCFMRQYLGNVIGKNLLYVGCER